VQPGDSIGPYVVRRHLGDGGMGSVWLADDSRLHRQVALKTLRASRTADTAGRERLMREARAAAALNHPNIATVYDVLEIDGDVVIVFEYVDGPTLATSLLDGPWSMDRVIAAATRLTKALVAAHAHGIVHRDLKPSNVIVGPDGDLKVLDFGIAKLLSLGTTVSLQQQTSSSGFIGTPAYAAPEQLLSPNVDERADLYALGVIIFELLTGRRPFAGVDAVEIASAKLGTPAPPLSSSGALVPAALDSLVAKLLQRQAADRPASASQVLTALRAISGDTATSHALPTRARWARWSIAAVTLFALAIITVITVGIPRGNRAAANGPPVVAVLPLRNTSGDASKDYLAAGLSENLIASLASSPSLIVLSRSAVADAVKSGANTAKDLGATFVIDGSVQQSAGQLRVAINLERADQSIAWGSTFDGTIERVFDLQTRMALAVSEAMSVRQSANSQPKSTTNADALAAYWRGRAFLDRWDVPGNIDASISALQEAISADANFALAHAGLGLAYWQKYTVTREQQFAHMAIEEGTKAASIDPNLPEVHFALAVSLNGTGRREDAIKEFRRAIALRPTFDEARRRLGSALASDGKIDEAVTEFQAAIALRPRFWSGYSEMGMALLSAARYDEALKAFEQVVALQPDNHIGYQQIGTVYQTKGDRQKAIDAYEKSLAIRPSFGVYSNLGMMQHLSGHYPEAVDAYRKALELRPNLASLYRNVGDAYLKMGKVAEARAEYQKAIERTEADLAVNPNSARSIAALAVYLAKAGRAKEANQRIAIALTMAPEDVSVRFRAAVVSSLNGDNAQALDRIADLLERGYSLAAVRDEEDFANLHGTQRFTELTHPQEPR
jgi:serine/threonine-protein kinase